MTKQLGRVKGGVIGAATIYSLLATVYSLPRLIYSLSPAIYSLQNKLYSLSQQFKSSLQRTQAAKNTPIIRGKITRLTKQLGRVKGEAIRYLDKIM
ncbi:MAG: hypothetical protein ACI383_06380, partial [Rummeliibacillus sp.]